MVFKIGGKEGLEKVICFENYVIVELNSGL